MEKTKARFQKTLFYGEEFDRVLNTFEKTLQRDPHFDSIKPKRSDQWFSPAVRMLIVDYIVARKSELGEEIPKEVTEKEEEIKDGEEVLIENERSDFDNQ